MDWHHAITQFWPHALAGLNFAAAVAASTHALLHKRDSRAATLWLGFIWLLPLLGSVLYVALGINRIRRRALSLRGENRARRSTPEDLGDPQQHDAEHLRHLATVVDRVVAEPLIAGNRVRALSNGDEAFPAMLESIESAKQTISLASYIFDNDETGKQFVAALARAQQRRVEVRVLIDDAGARYSWPSVTRELKRAKVPTGHFLPTLAARTFLAMNLRNHRKLLIADGRIAYTGGINIRHGNRLAMKPKSPVQDLHFQIEGPIVNRLQQAFTSDWEFTTGEPLGGESWFPELAECGKVVARVIPDGPDADFEKLRWTLLAALAEAQSSVQIVTPYFLPDPALVSALNLAALRGVRVDILLPAKSNLPFVHWASRALWWQVLERGCRLWLTPPPFDHSKLMIVDEHWVLLGSANWDARSLRLNFELNVECYGRGFAKEMSAVVQRKLEGAREITLAEADARPLPARLRDATARLFSPYL